MTEKKTKLRRDSQKNLIKVARVVLKNPDATEREIAKATGLSNGTAHNKLEQIEHVKSPFIDEVLRADEEIIKLAQDAIKAKLGDQEYLKTARASEISSVAQDSTKRFTLFKGDVTDKDGGLKINKDTPDDILEDILFPKKK